MEPGYKDRVLRSLQPALSVDYRGCPIASRFHD
jgi:hypothetical protein